MKIKPLQLHSLRNNELFEFCRELIALVGATTPAALKIEPQWAAFTALYAQADEALKKVEGSTITADIAELDHRRDNLIRGLRDLVDAGLLHFDDATHQAARRVEQVLDTYRDVLRLGVVEQTSAVYNLLVELTGEGHSADCERLGLVPWIGELDRVNTAIEKAFAARNDEEAARTTLVLKEVRAALTDAYRALTERIDALALIEGGAVYGRFIGELNVIVARYKDLVAARRGRAAAEKARGEAEAAAAAGVDVETWRSMQRAARAAEDAARRVAAGAARAAVVERSDAGAVEVVAAGEPKR
ncbi:MAG: DUF6261 family protein [Alistipes sp.]|jgi:hypothetical protein|nr:DUF6261 family protein [Alistipes sp.]